MHVQERVRKHSDITKNITVEFMRLRGAFSVSLRLSWQTLYDYCFFRPPTLSADTTVCYSYLHRNSVANVLIVCM
jgi:hypothetical protein